MDDRRNGSHRNGYDLVSYSDRQEDHFPRTPPRSEPQHGERREVQYDNAPTTPQQHRYRLTIADSNCRTLTDIRRVDVRLYLDDGSAVVIDDIPFYFVRQ